MSPVTASYFRELASGQKRGLWPALVRAALGVAEIPYALYIRRRNRRYDRGANPIERVGVPVVSVGNLTVGGTGKTPCVAWLARWFLAKGVRVAIVSRGYGAKGSGLNDEALELRQALPDVLHLQNPDRVAAARAAIEQENCDLILLDDAFQHRRLHRDLDIVLLDALEPFGFERLLPRGLLREPPASLARAHAICLSRADLLQPPERAAIRDQVRRFAPSAAWVELAHQPNRLVSASGEELPATSQSGRPIAAFCGIGNPTGFRRTLESCGYQISAWREFPDHHCYREQDIASLAAWAKENAASAVVCTNKDLVKLNVSQLGQLPLWALSVELEVLAGQAELESLLQALPLMTND